MLRIAQIVSRLLLLCLISFVACTPSSVDESKYAGRRVSIAYLQSLCRSKADAITEDLTIVGRVVANDKLRELNRAIAIMDDTAGIELKLDCSDIDMRIPLYSEVAVCCSGLWVGREGDKIVLGAQPTSHYVVDRVAEAKIDNILLSLELPDGAPQSRRRTIATIEPLDVSCLVRIENIRFLELADDVQWCERDALTGGYVTTLHYVEDGTGCIGVIVDGDCDYCMESLPKGEVTLYAVVDSYASERVLRITNQAIIEQ